MAQDKKWLSETSSDGGKDKEREREREALLNRFCVRNEAAFISRTFQYENFRIQLRIWHKFGACSKFYPYFSIISIIN